MNFIYNAIFHSKGHYKPKMEKIQIIRQYILYLRIYSRTQFIFIKKQNIPVKKLKEGECMFLLHRIIIHEENVHSINCEKMNSSNTNHFLYSFYREEY